MTNQHGIFFDEWQACLRAHFMHVVRANDTNTEVTLRGVLRQTGLTDGDLNDLRALAEDLGPLPDDGASSGSDSHGDTSSAAASDDLFEEDETLLGEIS